MRANETKAGTLNDAAALEDRKLFVYNFGELLSQTRNGIVSAELGDDELVTITFWNGNTRYVNVAADSYAAIIRDVSKYID